MVGTEEHKALVRRFVEEAINQGTLAVLDELVAPDFVSHTAALPLPPGPAGMRLFLSATRLVFPDLHQSIEDLVAEGEKVVVFWSARGTQQGMLLGIPPTGKSATWQGMTLFRVIDGKLAGSWQVLDQLGLLQQLGATITPPAPAP